jgi:hypothetical protein
MGAHDWGYALWKLEQFEGGLEHLSLEMMSRLARYDNVAKTSIISHGQS